MNCPLSSAKKHFSVSKNMFMFSQTKRVILYNCHTTKKMWQWTLVFEFEKAYERNSIAELHNSILNNIYFLKINKKLQFETQETF